MNILIKSSSFLAFFLTFCLATIGKGQVVDNVLHMYTDGGEGSLSYRGADIITLDDGMSYFIDVIYDSKLICPSAEIDIDFRNNVSNIIVGKLNKKNEMIDYTYFNLVWQGNPKGFAGAQYHLNYYNGNLYFCLNGLGKLYKDDVLISDTDIEKGVIIGLDEALNIVYQKDITSGYAQPVDLAFYHDKMYIYGKYAADTMSINGERISRLNVGGWSTSGFLYGIDMKTDKVFMKKSMAGAGIFFNTNIETDKDGNLYFGAVQDYSVFYIDTLKLPGYNYAPIGILFKLDSLGNIIRHFNFKPIDIGRSFLQKIEISDLGHVYVLGIVALALGQNGATDVKGRRDFGMFVEKFDLDFEPEWTKLIDTDGTGPFGQQGTDNLYLSDFDLDPTGNAYVSFWHNNKVVDDIAGNEYPRGAYIVKYTAEGTLDKIVSRTEYFGNTLLKFAVRGVDKLLMNHEYEDTAVELALFGIQGKGEDKVIYDLDIRNFTNSHVDDETEHQIQIYPNPSVSMNDNKLMVKSNLINPYSSFELIDLQGKVLLNGTMDGQYIDLSLLQDEIGMFFVRFTGSGVQSICKIVRI